MRLLTNLVAGLALACVAGTSGVQAQTLGDEMTHVQEASAPQEAVKATAAEGEKSSTSTEVESASAPAASTPEATAQEAEASTPAQAPVSKEPAEESKPAPRPGYSMIEKDGRTLYCRKVKAEPGTGSRVSAVTECRTAAQLDAEQKAAQK